MNKAAAGGVACGRVDERGKGAEGYVIGMKNLGR